MRRVNPENVAFWFNPWRLKAMFMLDGYDNYGAPLARILGVSAKTINNKVSYSRFGHEETLLIAKARKWDRDTYCDIFCKGMWDEDGNPIE